MSFVATQYRNTVVATASPVQVVVLLYDAAIRFMTQATLAIERDDQVEARDKLRRTQAIVGELRCSLDFRQSEELCRDLDRLYEFVLHTVTATFLSPSDHSLQPALSVMRELRGAWAEIAGTP